MLNRALPLHPTKVHPLTGQPLQAVGVLPTGRVVWPLMGGAPDDPPGSGGQAAVGGAGTVRTNATDAQGADLGFPKDTPVADMSDKEQAAYWRNNSRKHEGLWKNVAGDRKLEDVQNDLNDLAEIRKAEQTPAEQALSERFDQGKSEGLKAARAETAATIFRGALEAAEVKSDDVEDLVANFNVGNFVTDDGVDTTKITNFAKRFTPAGTGGQQRTRDFGAGSNRGGTSRSGGGSVAQVMADRAAARTANQPNSTS